MLTYLNDTAATRNAYPDYWGLSSEWEALSTIGREGYCISISIGAAYRLRAGGGAQAPLHPRVADVAALVTARWSQHDDFADVKPEG